ncbi:amidase domain-containing protein [Clostridiaceae bacterium M8S5]|nr:amidase domain-containing protein [Clostridiaceae bacterium M8S5]
MTNILRIKLFRLGVVFLCVCLVCITLYKYDKCTKNTVGQAELYQILEYIVINKNDALVYYDKSLIRDIYNVHISDGKYAYDNEVRKINYWHEWAEKQGINYNDIKSEILLHNIKYKDKKLIIDFSMCTKYYYSYKDTPNDVDCMRIGTSNILELEKSNDNYKITKEKSNAQYDLKEVFKDKKITTIINEQKMRSFTNLNDKNIAVVGYVNRYCGSAYKVTNQYNNKYVRLKEDCANFLSQALYEKGGFQKDEVWNYDIKASNAWRDKDAFIKYLIYNGKALQIEEGKYQEIYKSVYKLDPADIIVYIIDNKIEHIAMVVGADAKGYPLISSHGVDMYRVPWDLGWDSNKTIFKLLKVNYS